MNNIASDHRMNICDTSDITGSCIQKKRKRSQVN